MEKHIEFNHPVTITLVGEGELPRRVSIDPMRGGMLRPGKRKRPPFSWPARLVLFVALPVSACGIAAGAWVLWRLFIRHMCGV